MNRVRTHIGRCCAALLLFAAPGLRATAQQAPAKTGIHQLWYNIEWRMVTAGSVDLTYDHQRSGDVHINMDLESTGLVSRLYRVQDKYAATTNSQYCPYSADLDAQEGKKHLQTHLAFDTSRHRVNLTQRDFVKNKTDHKELDIPPCTFEITGALATVAKSGLQPGHSMFVPITDGAKVARARVEAQAREPVVLNGKTVQAIRYEAFLFDNVLYKRKGRLFIWVSDDADRTPVQFRIQLGFPIGNISVTLDPQHR